VTGDLIMALAVFAACVVESVEAACGPSTAPKGGSFISPVAFAVLSSTTLALAAASAVEFFTAFCAHSMASLKRPSR
jgi:hypothetical protein